MFDRLQLERTMMDEAAGRGDTCAARPVPATLGEVLRAATTRIAKSGSDTPRLDAEVLLRHVLGLDRAQLFSRLREPLALDAQNLLQLLVAQRIAEEPIAYLTGEREFMGRSFRVGRGVLIPRPETELLAEWAIEQLTSRPGGRLLDVGTGSGAIPLSVASLLPATWQGTIVGSDVSVTALGFARRNRDRLAPGHPVHLLRGDLTEWLADRSVAVLTANLPYLTPQQLASNAWLAAEPELALVSGGDGLTLIRRLIADLPRVLASGGSAGLELDPAQAEPVRTLLQTVFPLARVHVIDDLAGLARHVTVET